MNRQSKSPEIGRFMEAMKALDETPETLAERVNVASRTILNYIWGDKPLGGPLLRGLCDECGISVDWLLTGQGGMFRDEPIGLPPAHKPLLPFFETTDIGTVQDFWWLSARAAEESLITSGAVPGVDYQMLDLYRLAAPLVAEKLGENGLVLEAHAAFEK